MSDAADQQQIIAAMPASARRLVERMGYAPTLTVLRAYGGKRLYVPTTPTRKAGINIVANLGQDVAAALIAALGGTVFDVPNLFAVGGLLRDRALAADAGAGMSGRELVKKYQLADRTVRRKLAKVRGAPHR